MSEERKPLARSIGEFFGIIIKAAKEDVSATPAPTATDKPVVIREDVEEKTVDTPSGPMTLRRRTIDEVEGPGAKKLAPPHAPES